jgi:uncharacterized protein
VISSNSSIRSLFLDGPAGRLEALLNAGAENPTHAAVVCHPHPRFGGPLHNKVVLFAGFSFGAAVGLRAACPDMRVRAVVGVGTPVGPVAAESEVPRTYTFDFLGDCTKPKLFVSGARDQFGPRAKLEALVASMPEPKKLVLIEGADHFFEGRLRELREAIETWVKQAL